jgi:hypothetical protein
MTYPPSASGWSINRCLTLCPDRCLTYVVRLCTDRCLTLCTIQAHCPASNPPACQLSKKVYVPHTHTHTQTLTHRHTHTHAQPQTDTQTHAHNTCTHVQTHTHTHTHTHVCVHRPVSPTQPYASISKVPDWRSDVSRNGSVLVPAPRPNVKPGEEIYQDSIPMSISFCALRYLVPSLPTNVRHGYRASSCSC